MSPGIQVDDVHHHILPKILRGKRTPCILSALVLGFYFLLAVPAGCYGASQFFDHLDFADFKPDVGSELWQTDQYLRDWNYIGYFWDTPMYIMIQSNPRGQSVIDGQRGEEVAGFAQAILSNLQWGGIWGDFRWSACRIRSYFLPGYQNKTLVGGINNDTTVIAIDYARWNFRREERQAVEEFVNSAVAAAAALGDHYVATVTGIPALNSAMGDHVLPNMAFIDAIAIPTGLVMFAVATRSPFAIVIPLLVIICSVSTALGWGEVLKHDMKVTGFAPELMATTVKASCQGCASIMTIPTYAPHLHRWNCCG